MMNDLLFYFACLFVFTPVEQRTNEEFMKVNPTKRVPAIDDNGFCVSERWAGLHVQIVHHSSPYA